MFLMAWDSPATRTVDTGADGSFRIEWLPEKTRYGLGVLVEGLPIKMLNAVELGREDVEVVFAVPGSLAGTVVQAGTNVPLPRFLVHLEPSKETDIHQAPVQNHTQHIDKTGQRFSTVPEAWIGEASPDFKGFWVDYSQLKDDRNVRCMRTFGEEASNDREP